jgi:hypothetical protein
MIRGVTQILVGLMLLFAVLTLFPKAYLEFSAGKQSKGILSILLGFAAAFFSLIAFYHACLIFRQ